MMKDHPCIQSSIDWVLNSKRNFSCSRRTRPKSEFTTKSHHPTASRATNPYAQLIERLRKAEKSNLINELPSRPTSIQIDTNTHHRIQKLLSFLHSLDDTTDNTLNENTIIALFSVDNHLSSSIYVPNNIQQLNIIPKTILHSLRNTSDNEQMLNQVSDYWIKSNVFISW